MRISVEEAARRLGIHPFEVVRHLARHRQSFDGFEIEADLLPTLTGWAGLEDWWDEEPPPAPAGPGSTVPAVREDPHPRRMIARWIPFKLRQKGKVGASHTRIDNAWRGLPGDLRGFGKQVVEQMKREGLLRSKPTVNGEHIFLVPERLDDVQRLIDWNDPPRAFRLLVGE
jgi:hypothetical protein